MSFSVLKLKVPALVAGGLFGIVLGASGTAATMISLGYHRGEKIVEKIVPQETKKDDAERKKKIEAFRERYWKFRLTSLVRRLDLLTDKSPQLNLTVQEQTKLIAHLKDLDQIKEIDAKLARERFTNILKTLEKHATVLRSAGLRVPGQKMKLPKDRPNPFTSGSNQERLQSLRSRFPSAS